MTRNSPLLSLVFASLSVLGYGVVAYGLSRENTAALLLTFGLLFAFLWGLQKQALSWKNLFLGGLLFRLIFFLGLPTLSQDFYRYCWDGNLMLMGINPYLHTPNALINLVQFPHASLLYEQMGELSNANHSNYPPLSQYTFQGMALLAQNALLPGLLFLRCVYLIIEGILFLWGKKLLEKMGLSSTLWGWYFLNPLLIVETYGNLHGEGLMLSLFLLGLGFLFQHRFFISGLFISFSIAFKLFPLLFLPLFFFIIPLKKRLLFYSTLALSLLLISLPFLSATSVANYGKTLFLWFDTFEFNASFHYLIRALSHELVGYNLIKETGKLMPFLLLAVVSFFTLKNKKLNQKQLLTNLLWVCSIYLFSATTVHPWYVINLLGLGVLTGYLFPVVWSATVWWSYSAYGTPKVEESSLLIALEYMAVYGCLFYELWKKPLLKHL